MKTKSRKVGLLFLSLFLVAATVGCPAPVDELGGLTSAELEERIITALRAVETVQFEQETINKSMDKEIEGVVIRSWTQSTAAAVDIVNKRSKATTTLVHRGRWGVSEQETIGYFVDGVYYSKRIEPGIPAQWMKWEGPWNPMTLPTEMIIQWLNMSELELLGTEKIRGINCFVVSVVPDFEMFLQEQMRQLEETKQAFPDMVEELPSPEDMETMIRDLLGNLTFKLWVCKETFLPAREHQKWTGVDTLGDLEVIAVKDTTAYFVYNQPVTIDLPPEAAHAVRREEFFELDQPVMPPEPSPAVP
ncbi:hypothetical protein M1N83_00900 [Dehalococcoidia bacterium]|nr:hypothetical protein [Dehalococcoidia bacterium]